MCAWAETLLWHELHAADTAPSRLDSAGLNSVALAPRAGWASITDQASRGLDGTLYVPARWQVLQSATCAGYTTFSNTIGPLPPLASGLPRMKLNGSAGFCALRWAPAWIEWIRSLKLLDFCE